MKNPNSPLREGRPSDHVRWVDSKNAVKLPLREYPTAPLWDLETALSWVVNKGREQEISAVPVESQLVAAKLYGGPLATAATELLSVLRDGKLPAWRIQDGVSSAVDPITWRAARNFTVIANWKDCVVDAARLKGLFSAKKGRPRGAHVTPERLEAMKEWISGKLKANPDLAARDAEKAYVEALGTAALSRDKYFRPKFKEMANASKVGAKPCG